MKTIIGKRWTVEGFYRHHKTTSAWEFESPYRDGEVVWELTGEVLTCYVDGHIDHTVPYTVFEGDKLFIDFSAMIPHKLAKYIEKYRIEMREGEVWLYDLTTRLTPETPDDFWLAIKLLPAE
jgi:hypothetical protein